MSEYIAHGNHEYAPIITREIQDDLVPYEQVAQKLAERLRRNPEQRQFLETFERFLVGSGDRDKRINGGHPWPSREIDEQTRSYTIPVFAGFSNINTVLAVLKDPWHHHQDPSDWLVGRLALDTGAYTEYKVSAVQADSGNRVVLQITDPIDYYNMPPGMRPSSNRLVRDWHRVSLHLDKDYFTDEAEIRYGMNGALAFYDIQHLHRAMDTTTEEDAVVCRVTSKGDVMARLALSRLLRRAA